MKERRRNDRPNSSVGDDPAGQDLTEYALITGGVAIALIAAVAVFSGAIGAWFEAMGTWFSTLSPA